MDAREMLIDGVDQMTDWLGTAIKDLSNEQVNHQPGGHAVNIGFNAWHVIRTTDNITNFVMQDRKPPIWMTKGYNESWGLPAVAQGTGMSMEEAQSLVFDRDRLMQYLSEVREDTLAFLKVVPEAKLDEVQMVKPLGEMPKWRVFRQVVMTHGFMHLGEINAVKGQLGLGFFI
ncbi:MAG TPA: DinB family protein [Tepidiformaceae bacterium]|nr:DinB family protein [Tepidiformaceae bacterium]HNO65134.1 DinB family protein [Tepidiformaceae bacterium]